MSKKSVRMFFIIFSGILILPLVSFLPCGHVGTAWAGIEAEFHGYFESTNVIRDSDGFQGGFMDNAEMVQQRNTLKFDVDVYPNVSIGPVDWSKMHFTYRGAYDSVFDWRDKYSDIRKDKPSRADLCIDDIHFENDLREITADLELNGDYGRLMVRPGRQIVSWGVTTGPVTLVDQISPYDISFQRAFSDPADLKIPMWMVRAIHEFPILKPINTKFSLDGLFIFDQQQNLNAPLDAEMNAPYAQMWEGLKAMQADIRESVPTGNEYALRLGMETGPYFRASLLFMRSYYNAPAMTMKMTPIPVAPYMIPETVFFDHPQFDLYGAYFDVYVESIGAILKGEVSYSDGEPLGRSADFNMGKMETYLWEEGKVLRGMLGINKPISAPWLTKDGCVTTDFQMIQSHIEDWHSALSAKKDTTTFTASLSWNWLNGAMMPVIFLAYEPTDDGVWMTSASIRHDLPFQGWYYKVKQSSYYGDKDSRSQLASSINSSEVAFILGYCW